jgi:microcystin-dependent protein
MGQQYLGQIQPFGFAFAPKGWAFCNGQILSIAQNTALFALLGTTYGGNGTSTFGLPDLRSRVPMHFGTDPNGIIYVQGEMGGVENVALSSNQMPSHNHAFSGTASAANETKPAAGAALAMVHHSGGTTPNFYYAPDTALQGINAMSLSLVGNGQPHTNVQPCLTINWCIALIGIFPSRN